MSSSTEDRMDEIVAAARAIVKAARAHDADAVLEHANQVSLPARIINDDLSSDIWSGRESTERALETWASRR